MILRKAAKLKNPDKTVSEMHLVTYSRKTGKGWNKSFIYKKMTNNRLGEKGYVKFCF